MDYIKKAEILERGFERVRLETDDYYGINLDNGVFILARHVGGNDYEIHEAQDARGNHYDSFALNGFGFFENVNNIDELSHFLANPDLSKVAGV